jgi:hypothetical protein
MSIREQFDALIGELAALEATSDDDRLALVTELAQLQKVATAAQARLAAALAASQRARLVRAGFRIGVRPASGGGP